MGRRTSIFKAPTPEPANGIKTYFPVVVEAKTEDTRKLLPSVSFEGTGWASLPVSTEYEKLIGAASCSLHVTDAQPSGEQAEMPDPPLATASCLLPHGTAQGVEASVLRTYCQLLSPGQPKLHQLPIMQYALTQSTRAWPN